MSSGFVASSGNCRQLHYSIPVIRAPPRVLRNEPKGKCMTASTYANTKPQVVQKRAKDIKKPWTSDASKDASTKILDKASDLVLPELDDKVQKKQKHR